MNTIAKQRIIPDKGIFRTVFVYIGQGEATIMAIPDGNAHKIVLIDCHIDGQFGGVDLPKLLNDLTDTIDIFINTHPHNDHLKGIKKIYEKVFISEVWHSGHNPGKEHKEAYDELNAIIKELPDDRVICLEGSRSDNLIGNVTYNVLAPASYVADDIEGEKPEARYRRIHEQCAVLRFSYGNPNPTSILITGDSDLVAWRDHITSYHQERLPAVVLSASHHGSRSFFVENEGDDPYLDHIEAIQPQYLVISAPTSDESPHDHPHEDALEIYRKYLDDDDILHLGANRECVVVDIKEDGEIEVYVDKELVEYYGADSDEDGDGGSSKKSAVFGTVYTSLDRKPMGR